MRGVSRIYLCKTRLGDIIFAREQEILAHKTVTDFVFVGENGEAQNNVGVCKL